jgi:hypothetical protein
MFLVEQINKTRGCKNPLLKTDNMLPFPNEVQKVATSQLERFLKTLDELKKVYKEELKRRKNPVKNVPRGINQDD